VAGGDRQQPMTPTARPFVLVPTRARDNLAWMRPDLLVRLLPFSAVPLGAWLVWRPAWAGLSTGRADVQLAFGLPAAVLFFVAGALVQRAATGWRGHLAVPASGATAALLAAYFLVNAPVEEAFFRGLVQGGVGSLAGPAAGLAAGTSLYVLYHRLGRWAWLDVLATALVGVPVALAFWLLPGPPSLLGVSLAHFGATCGFLGPGPWLLRRLGLLEARPGGPP
jgi:membrane protease YdiL (CAAX protease family)